MKPIYVVRGEGICGEDNVWFSRDFSVTMLHQTCKSRDNCWCARGIDGVCYDGFKGSTGIELEPGEYVELRVREA